MTVLDLDATPPPRAPKQQRLPVLGVRLPRALYEFVREQARVDHVTMSGWVVALVRRERDAPHLPADVRDWLTVQAAQCGRPGDVDGTLLEVVRHLADRWPNGARLR